MNCLAVSAEGLILRAVDALTEADCRQLGSEYPEARILMVGLPPGYTGSCSSSSCGSSADSPPASAEELGAAWAASFVVVVGCYVIARSAGVVLSLLK